MLADVLAGEVLCVTLWRDDTASDVASIMNDHTHRVTPHFALRQGLAGPFPFLFLLDMEQARLAGLFTISTPSSPRRGDATAICAKNTTLLCICILHCMQKSPSCKHASEQVAACSPIVIRDARQARHSSMRPGGFGLSLDGASAFTPSAPATISSNRSAYFRTCASIQASFGGSLEIYPTPR